jgi:hypothetical protein
LGGLFSESINKKPVSCSFQNWIFVCEQKWTG